MAIPVTTKRLAVASTSYELMLAQAIGSILLSPINGLFCCCVAEVKLRRVPTLKRPIPIGKIIN